MRIGLDFDNTLARYDRVFCDAALARGYIPSAAGVSKLDVRHMVRALADGEKKWMALQGEVYGKRMSGAELMPGAAAFLKRCKSLRMDVVIVSHKTEFGHYDADKVNLRDAAREWMTDQGFFDADGFALRHDSVYFESTRAGKVARIASLGCSHFVDDLIEVFAEPGFPAATAKLLFDPSGHADTAISYDIHRDWKSIERATLGE